MKQSQVSVLFLGRNDIGIHHCEKAIAYCQERFPNLTVALGKWGDPLPSNAKNWKGDFIISYLSRWVVKESLLKQAKIAAINFHPASPDYPGIGCNNFALYENAKEYGVTCHHMNSKVDTGQIIATKRFPMSTEDTVETLLTRTYDNMILLFQEIVDCISQGKTLPASTEKWTRKPFTRAEFNQLCEISSSMPEEEKRQRIRATSYQNWKPKING